MVGAVFWKPVQAGVCGQAVDERDAVEKAIELDPDVALVDVSMPHVNGFEVARCIHERMPDCRILLVTEQDPVSSHFYHLSPACLGYVVESRITLDLLPAVDSASKHLPSSAPGSKIA